jgi:TRAP-type C4-dicarboxylate transport system permease small subunit
MAQAVTAALARLDQAGRLVEDVLLVTLLGGMMLVAVGQVIAREIFETGFFLAGELVRLMVLWLAMVGSIAACRENRHIRIDAISHLLSDRAVGIVRMLVDTFAAVVCGVIAWNAWRYLQLEIEFEDTVLIDTPAWVAHLVVPVAFALLSYRFLVLVLQTAVEIFVGEKEVDE